MSTETENQNESPASHTVKLKTYLRSQTLSQEAPEKKDLRL